MWKLTLVIQVVDVLLSLAVALPSVQNDVVKNFQAAVHRQDLQSILMSIEERLRNLDNIYSMQLSPTLEDKLEQYQRKLDSIDTKIIRLESLVMLNLDKISENISTKNFKDDISKTNLVKKVDAVYEGISHRLNYMDRKFETSAGKMQGKLEATLTRLERMDDSLATRNEEIEIELSDAIAAIDDLKTSNSLMEENIVNNTNENFEISLKEQMSLMQTFNDKTNKAIQILYENTTKNFDKLEQEMEKGLQAINETDRFLEGLKFELKRELNEYAVKVAEMNSENWKTGTFLQNKQNRLENIINSTKSEIQNGIRALMVLIGKITNKEPLQQDQAQIDKLTEKIDTNFEKVFTTQNLFMDSCYRLQMDESQIESKISDILEKLIETFEKKTAVETDDIKNLEKIIKNHDSHITRNLYQANTNVVTTYEKMSKDHKKFETELKQVSDHLSALFSLIQDTLSDENGSLSPKNVNILLKDLEGIEKKITSLYQQGDVLSKSVEEIKGIVGDEHRGNSRDEYFRNISQAIRGIEAKVNEAYLYYYFNRSRIDAITLNVTEQLRHSLEVIKDKKAPEISEITPETNTTKIDKLIEQIFGIRTDYNETEEIQNKPKNDCDLINIIDVRSSADCETATEINEVTTEMDEITSKSHERLDSSMQQIVD